MNRAALPTAVMLLCQFLLTGCDRDASPRLKGQANATLTFYGLVVDQDGNPLSHAQIEYYVEAYPKDWTFETRGRPYDVSKIADTSDAFGRFQFEVTGCSLRLSKAEREGYRHLLEKDAHTDAQSTYAYQLIAWSDLWYKTDSDHPAIYVFVKDGVHEVSALPCKGGFDSGGGTQWVINKPAWPKQPSLKDVVYKPPTTQSTSQP